VAEKSRVPLYAVSAGVLGTTPHEVEKALDQSLDLCRLWNAILLLDEADVFLGTRTNDGLLRNELVSCKLTAYFALELKTKVRQYSLPNSSTIKEFCSSQPIGSPVLITHSSPGSICFFPIMISIQKTCLGKLHQSPGSSEF
jgi:hypothetical protein